jgi:hypothetical protein
VSPEARHEPAVRREKTQVSTYEVNVTVGQVENTDGMQVLLTISLGSASEPCIQGR